MAMNSALDNIQKSDITTICALSDGNDLVLNLFKALGIILGKDVQDWSEVQTKIL